MEKDPHGLLTAAMRVFFWAHPEKSERDARFMDESHCRERGEALRLDEFDDAAITRIVSRAMFFIRCPGRLSHDVRQLGALKAIELRRRLRATSPGCRILSQRNICFYVFKAMKRSLVQRVPTEAYVEFSAVENTGLDFTEQAMLEARLLHLSPREMVTIKAHFYEGFSMSDIAEKQGVTKQRISKIIARALKKMREETNERRKPQHV